MTQVLWKTVEGMLDLGWVYQEVYIAVSKDEYLVNMLAGYNGGKYSKQREQLRAKIQNGEFYCMRSLDRESRKQNMDFLFCNCREFEFYSK